jgi:hypothetical protein
VSREPGDRLRQIARRALPGTLLALVVCGVYSDALFSRRNFGGRDLLAYNLPMENAVHAAYARGRLPVWMTEVSGGRPLLPNPNAGALYPARPLLALFPFPLAMRLFPLFHWALAGIGVLCLARSIGASRAAAWVAAVTYAFSGVAVSEVFFPHILPGLALLPWIVLSAGRPGIPGIRRVLLLSFLFALVFLAGDVFSSGLAVACASLWILLEEPRALRAREFLRLGCSLLLAALAAAPQIVATLLWIPETGRAVTGLTLGESLLYSISPFRLLELVVPYPFGSTSALDVSEVWSRAVFHGKALGLFATLYAGAFAVVGALTARRERARGARFARVLGLAVLVVSVPPSLLPASWGRLASPISLRNPEKFAVGLALALAILAALAFDRFRKLAPRPRGMLVAAKILCLLAAASWLWPDAAGKFALRFTGDASGPARLAGEKLAIAFAEAGLLWIATLLALEALRALPRAGLPVCLALLTVCPIAANRRIATTFREEALFSPTPFARFLRRADPQGAYRTMGVAGYRPPSALQEAEAGNDPGQIEFSRRNWHQYTPALWQRGTVFNGDFDAGDLSRLQSLRSVSFRAAGHGEASAFFGALALRFGIRFRDQAPLPGYHRVRGDALMDWDEHEEAYPDIRLLEKWREETGAVQALNLLPLLKDGEIVVESGSRAAGSARPGRLRVLERTPERLSLETVTPDATWLFVLRGYWSERTVSVDGREAEDAPAQLAFSAVRVPAGRHRIEWKEEVPGWKISRFGPVLSALALLWFLRRGREGSAESQRP